MASARVDRTLIAPLLLEYYPTMDKATSDEWHGFLNAETGLDIDIDEENATAFDKWRMALAEQKQLPVWGYTAEKVQAIQARGIELKAAEDARVTALAATLAALALEAPTKTPEQLIADTNKAAGA